MKTELDVLREQVAELEEIAAMARELVIELKQDDAAFVHPHSEIYDASLRDAIEEKAHRLDLKLMAWEASR